MPGNLKQARRIIFENQDFVLDIVSYLARLHKILSSDFTKLTGQAIFYSCNFLISANFKIKYMSRLTSQSSIFVQLSRKSNDKFNKNEDEHLFQIIELTKILGNLQYKLGKLKNLLHKAINIFNRVKSEELKLQDMIMLAEKNFRDLIIDFDGLDFLKSKSQFSKNVFDWVYKSSNYAY